MYYWKRLNWVINELDLCFVPLSILLCSAAQSRSIYKPIMAYHLPSLYIPFAKLQKFYYFIYFLCYYREFLFGFSLYSAFPDNSNAWSHIWFFKEKLFRMYYWVLEIFKAKHKIGYIDGTILKTIYKSRLNLLTPANFMVVGWISTSIDPQVRSTVSYVPGTHQLCK